MNKFIEIALSEWNVTATTGADKYFAETGRKDFNAKDTSWCDAFADWVVMKAGAQPSPGLNARAWLNVGEVVEDPHMGDIVVLWREKPDSWKGHVGFFIRQTETHAYLLGGNQSGKVQISAYPINRVLGYRRIVADAPKAAPTLEDIRDMIDALTPKRKEELADLLMAPKPQKEVHIMHSSDYHSF